MAEVLKRLGASVVVANTDTALYVCPTAKQTSVSSILAINRGATLRTFRIAHVDGAIGDVASADYIAYDFEIPPLSSIVYTIGICMSAADTLLVRANHADISFIAWGAES